VNSLSSAELMFFLVDKFVSILFCDLLSIRGYFGLIGVTFYGGMRIISFKCFLRA
jgi:hypothetical protein